MAKDKKFSGIDSPISNKVKKLIQITSTLVVVVAQLAERSLPIPDFRGSNPDTGKFL